VRLNKAISWYNRIKGVIVLLELEQNWIKDPVGALLLIKERAYDHDRFTIEEYLDVLAQNLWKFQSIGIDIKGESLEEKCSSCLEQLVSLGMVTLIH
jgi:two-component sensor histidine kinase